MEAVEQAPRTETGLIIPPHIAAERQRVAAAPTLEQAKPNRAQRRRQEKAQRRAAKRQRHLERAPADAQQALREAEEIVPHLTEAELLMAEALVREIGQDPERAQEIVDENMERSG